MGQKEHAHTTTLLLSSSASCSRLAGQTHLQATCASFVVTPAGKVGRRWGSHSRPPANDVLPAPAAPGALQAAENCPSAVTELTITTDEGVIGPAIDRDVDASVQNATPRFDGYQVKSIDG